MCNHKKKLDRIGQKKESEGSGEADENIMCNQKKNCSHSV